MKGGEYLIDNIKALITAPEFQLKHSIKDADFTRRRKLRFVKIIFMLLTLLKRSLQIECEFLGVSESGMLPSKQAFSKAR